MKNTAISFYLTDILMHVHQNFEFIGLQVHICGLMFNNNWASSISR